MRSLLRTGLAACFFLLGCAAANAAPRLPAINSLSPASAVAGGRYFTLDVYGNWLNSNPIVLWNGSARSTFSVGPLRVQGVITEADIAAVGTAQVQVRTNRGTSNILTFTITAAPTSPSPTFSDSFDTGVLSPAWIVSNWSAPGGGVFSPSNVDVSQGCLRLKLTQTQNPDGSISSVGGEIQSVKQYGYGTYEWIMRVGSTSSTLTGSGQFVSGGVSAGFSFYNKSQTEVDFEVEGQHPNTIWMTNWTSTSSKQTSNAFLSAPEAGLHSYKFVWKAGQIDFYLDGVLVSTHTSNVPSAPAYVMMNHWGTNSINWGGVGTPGVDRYMYVTKVTFTE